MFEAWGFPRRRELHWRLGSLVRLQSCSAAASLHEAWAPDATILSSCQIVCISNLPANDSVGAWAVGGPWEPRVLFVRPCAAVAAHMLQLAAGNRLLQFPYHDAEQDFFDWCAAAITKTF